MKKLITILTLASNLSFAGTIQIECSAQITPAMSVKAFSFGGGKTLAEAKGFAEENCRSLMIWKAQGLALSNETYAMSKVVSDFCSKTKTGAVRVTCKAKETPTQWVSATTTGAGSEQDAFYTATSGCVDSLYDKSEFDIEELSIQLTEVQVLESFCK